MASHKAAAAYWETRIAELDSLLKSLETHVPTIPQETLAPTSRINCNRKLTYSSCLSENHQVRRKYRTYKARTDRDRNRSKGAPASLNPTRKLGSLSFKSSCNQKCLLCVNELSAHNRTPHNSVFAVSSEHLQVSSVQELGIKHTSAIPSDGSCSEDGNSCRSSQGCQSCDEVLAWLRQILRDVAPQKQEPRGTRGKSLFSMCLRKVATTIDDAEEWTESYQNCEFEETNTCFNLGTYPTTWEVMSALEPYGTQVLCQTTLARGISRISVAYSRDILCSSSINLCLRLLYDNRYYWETLQLAESMPRSLSRPSSYTQRFQQVAELRPLACVMKAFTGSGYEHIKIACMTSLLCKHKLPAEWLETVEFQDILKLYFDFLEEGRGFDYVRKLTNTVLERILEFEASPSRAKKIVKTDAKSFLDSFAATLATIAIFAEDEGSRQRSRSMIDSCLSHLQIWMHGRHDFGEHESVLLATSYLAGCSGSSQHIELLKDRLGILSRQMIDQKERQRLVYLFSYIAALGSRFQGEAPMNCLTNIFLNLQALGLPSRTHSMLWRGALAMLPQIELGEHWRRFGMCCVESWGLRSAWNKVGKDADVGVVNSKFWLWEDGIEEWVQKTAQLIPTRVERKERLGIFNSLASAT